MKNIVLAVALIVIPVISYSKQKTIGQTIADGTSTLQGLLTVEDSKEKKTAQTKDKRLTRSEMERQLREANLNFAIAKKECSDLKLIVAEKKLELAKLANHIESQNRLIESQKKLIDGLTKSNEWYKQREMLLSR